jgi:hypothetical protein
MDWFHIYAIDVLTAERNLKNRIRNHPLFTLWFLFLAFGFVWFFLRIYTFSTEQVVGGLFADIEANSIYFIIFIIFFAKSVSDSFRKIAQNKALVFNLNQPLKQINVIFGKIVSEIVFNLGLLVLLYGLVVANVLIFNYSLAGDFWFVVNSVLICILSTILGTVFSIFNVFPLKRRFKLLFTIIPLLGLLYYVLYYISIAGPLLFLILLILTLISSALIFVCNMVFLDAWNRGTNPGKNLRMSRFIYGNHKGGGLMVKLLPDALGALFRREIARKMRSREFVGTVITIIAISYGSLYIAGDYTQDDILQANFGFLFAPMVIGLGIFAAALLEPGISQLSTIGREGKNIWILKSSPLSGANIIQTKALANMISTPMIIIGPGIFVTLYTGYSIYAGLFSALAALTMVFLFTGLGAWFGAKYANFDESVKGYPDIMTVYIFSMVCLIFGVIFCFIPLGVYFFDFFLGILAMIFFADLAALVLYLGSMLGGSELDKLEIT